MTFAPPRSSHTAYASPLGWTAIAGSANSSGCARAGVEIVVTLSLQPGCASAIDTTPVTITRTAADRSRIGCVRRLWHDDADHVGGRTRSAVVDGDHPQRMGSGPTLP